MVASEAGRSGCPGELLARRKEWDEEWEAAELRGRARASCLPAAQGPTLPGTLQRSRTGPQNWSSSRAGNQGRSRKA